MSGGQRRVRRAVGPGHGSAPLAFAVLSAVLVLLSGTVWSGAGAVGAQGVPAPERMAVQLRERNDSGVGGRARLTAIDGATAVVITLSGQVADFLPVLHRGTCRRYDAEDAIPLALVTAGTPSRATIDIALGELVGGYVIAVHRLGDDIAALLSAETSVACGAVAVPAAAKPAPPATVPNVVPPVAGIGFDTQDRGAASRAALALLAALCASFAVRLRPSTMRPAPAVAPVAGRRLGSRAG